MVIQITQPSDMQCKRTLFKIGHVMDVCLNKYEGKILLYTLTYIQMTTRKLLLERVIDVVRI